MYFVQNQNKKKPLKVLLTAMLAVCYIFSFAQQNQSLAYKKALKEFRKVAYNLNLIAHSASQPDKKCDNYKGGPINTTDAQFFFGDGQLSDYFPTNADKIRNQYLAFYFSQKTAMCPTLFSLLNYYEATIEKYLTANNLPKELKLLPVVCSAFNPYSDNGLGGYGFWHLNYPQAIKYGLTVNRFIDERADFEKSTRAAALYLKDLYSIYKDWELTLTAYSCGVSTVNKLLNRHAANSYKEIYAYLPAATKDLVQAFVAMNYIYNYDNYGAIDLNPIIDIDTVAIERKLQFEAANRVIGTTTKEIKFLNPTLTSETFPEKFTAYLPKGKGLIFNELRDSIYFYQDSVMNNPITTEPEFTIPKDGEPYIYTVRSGDVLGLIADRNNVRVSQIQDWNGLNGTRINIGQKLTIYGKNTTVKKKEPKEDKGAIKDNTNESNKKQETKPSKSKNQNPAPKTGDYSTYTVKSGDNLWIIAKKYSGVSAQNIMNFNGINANLNVGQVIKIPKY